jgi:hypothetical protein
MTPVDVAEFVNDLPGSFGHGKALLELGGSGRGMSCGVEFLELEEKRRPDTVAEAPDIPKPVELDALHVFRLEIDDEGVVSGASRRGDEELLLGSVPAAATRGLLPRELGDRAEFTRELHLTAVLEVSALFLELVEKKGHGLFLGPVKNSLRL